MKVKEIMKRYVVSVKPEDRVKNVLSLLFKMRISGLPVIDEHGKLIGMFTEKDVLSHTLSGYIDKVGRSVYGDNPKSTKRKFTEISKLKISQLMRKDVVTITEDASLCEVARVMLAERARRIPVLDNLGKVTGIIARCDVLKALAKEADMPIDNKAG